MTSLFRRLGRPVAGSAAATALILGLVALAFQFSSPARAGSTTRNVADTVNNAPTGPATVSVSSTTAFGKVLVVGGSGAFDGCSLYLLHTSDQLRAMTGSQFACSDGLNAKGLPCDTVLWRHCSPTVPPSRDRGLTQTARHGDPHRPAGSGNGAAGDLRRSPAVPVQQRPKTRGRRKGPMCSTRCPALRASGIWSSRVCGHPAPGTALLQSETAPLGGTDINKTVLALTMDQDFTPFLPTAAVPSPPFTPHSVHSLSKPMLSSVPGTGKAACLTCVRAVPAAGP